MSVQTKIVEIADHDIVMCRTAAEERREIIATIESRIAPFQFREFVSFVWCEARRMRIYEVLVDDPPKVKKGGGCVIGYHRPARRK